MWFNEQEREEMEYQWGAASEAQNLMAMSAMERAPDDSAAIRAAVQAGSFVAVGDAQVYCRHTDALIGSDKQLLGMSDTYAGAQALLEAAAGPDPCPDVSYYVLGPSRGRPAPTAAAGCDDIPF